jgi:hypothetical protein
VTLKQIRKQLLTEQIGFSRAAGFKLNNRPYIMEYTPNYLLVDDVPARYTLSSKIHQNAIDIYRSHPCYWLMTGTKCHLPLTPTPPPSPCLQSVLALYGQTVVSKMKIIVMIREPVARARSSWVFKKSKSYRKSAVPDWSDVVKKVSGAAAAPVPYTYV